MLRESPMFIEVDTCDDTGNERGPQVLRVNAIHSFVPHQTDDGEDFCLAIMAGNVHVVICQTYNETKAMLNL